MLKKSVSILTLIVTSACISIAKPESTTIASRVATNSDSRVQLSVALEFDRKVDQDLVLVRINIRNSSTGAICFPEEQLPEGNWIFGNVISIKHNDVAVPRKRGNFGQLAPGGSFRYVAVAPNTAFTKSFELTDIFEFSKNKSEYSLEATIIGLHCSDLDYGLFDFRDYARNRSVKGADKSKAVFELRTSPMRFTFNPAEK